MNVMYSISVNVHMNVMYNMNVCYASIIKSVLDQSLVSCGGGWRPADALRQQHVPTIPAPSDCSCGTL
jgi:hypothetical protein